MVLIVPLRNCIIVITGQKGSGKTTFSKYLVAKCRRRIVVDRLLEYQDGAQFRRVTPLVDYLASHWRDDQLSVTVRLRSEYEHALFFEFLYRSCDLEDVPPLPPTLLCVEEIDFFAQTAWIDPNLKAMFDYGRHWNMSIVAIVRQDTGTHRSVIHGSDVIVCLRQHKFSQDMRERFTAEELQRVMQLETLTPGNEPQYGVHYLTFPETVSPIRELEAAMNPNAVEP